MQFKLIMSMRKLTFIYNFTKSLGLRITIQRNKSLKDEVVLKTDFNLVGPLDFFINTILDLLASLKMWFNIFLYIHQRLDKFNHLPLFSLNTVGFVRIFF